VTLPGREDGGLGRLCGDGAGESSIWLFCKEQRQTQLETSVHQALTLLAHGKSFRAHRTPQTGLEARLKQ
jgi:hypothetical protein